MRVEIEKKGGWAGGGKREVAAPVWLKNIFLFWAYSFEREYCVTIVNTC